MLKPNCSRPISSAGEPHLRRADQAAGVVDQAHGLERRGAIAATPPDVQPLQELGRGAEQRGGRSALHSGDHSGDRQAQATTTRLRDRCKVAIQTNNVETDERGYIYMVDRANTGLHILELTGAGARHRRHCSEAQRCARWPVIAFMVLMAPRWVFRRRGLLKGARRASDAQEWRVAGDRLAVFPRDGWPVGRAFRCSIERRGAAR